MENKEEYTFTLDDVYNIQNTTFIALVNVLEAKGVFSYKELAEHLEAVADADEEASQSVMMYLTGLVNTLKDAE